MRFGRRAFTLIELLVVIAIIAILAGLLLPTLARGTAAARATECRGNLRDVALGLRMYLDDFDVYPMFGGIGIAGYTPQAGWLMMNDWKATLGPFLGVRTSAAGMTPLQLRKLRCPEIQRGGGIRINGQYAYNAAGTAPVGDRWDLGLGGHANRPTREAAVAVPADMIAVGDVDIRPAKSPAFSPGDFWSAGHFDVVSTQAWFWPGQGHRGQGNVVFCDSHVESGRPAAWASTNLASRARWNSDHQPHPETWKRP